MPDTYNLDVILRAKAQGMAVMKEAENSLKGINLAAVGLAAGLGILVMGGKSMIENSRAFEDAQLSLAQALHGNTKNLAIMQARFDAWSETNKRYVPNQFAAERALASFMRAGSNAKEALRLLNDALDLTILKGGDMTDNAKLLTLALAGNTRGTRFLGISTAELTAITKSHLTTAQKHDALLKLIEKKTKDGRKAQDDLAQSSNELNKHWQDLSKKGGPVLTKLLDVVVTSLSKAYDWFDRIGKDNKLWATISDRLVKMAGWIHDYLIKPMQDFGAWLNTDQQKAASQAAGQAGRYGYGGTTTFTTGNIGSGKLKPAATGYHGTVYRPTLFLAGEGGAPEDVNIGPRGSGGVGMSTHRIERLLEQLIAQTAPPTGQPQVASNLYKAMQGAGMNRLRGMAGA